MNTRAFAFVASCVAVAGSAHAAITGTFTADNHYAIYEEIGGVITLIGGNELGAGGAPGTYNWSLPEIHAISGDASVLYIAAWSDDRVAQGLLGEINLGNGVWLRSGDIRWDYYCTNTNLGDGAPWPSAGDISAHVATADANNAWMKPDVGGQNIAATGPWGKVAGISDDARWMWGNPDSAASAFQGGANHDEYQIFRITIPSPGVVSVASLAGLLVTRRRRA